MTSDMSPVLSQAQRAIDNAPESINPSAYEITRYGPCDTQEHMDEVVDIQRRFASLLLNTHALMNFTIQAVDADTLPSTWGMVAEDEYLLRYNGQGPIAMRRASPIEGAAASEQEYISHEQHGGYISDVIFDTLGNATSWHVRDPSLLTAILLQHRYAMDYTNHLLDQAKQAGVHDNEWQEVIEAHNGLYAANTHNLTTVLPATILRHAAHTGTPVDPLNPRKLTAEEIKEGILAVKKQGSYAIEYANNMIEDDESVTVESRVMRCPMDRHITQTYSIGVPFIYEAINAGKNQFTNLYQASIDLPGVISKLLSSPRAVFF